SRRRAGRALVRPQGVLEAGWVVPAAASCGRPGSLPARPDAARRRGPGSDPEEGGLRFIPRKISLSGSRRKRGVAFIRRDRPARPGPGLGWRGIGAAAGSVPPRRVRGRREPPRREHARVRPGRLLRTLARRAHLREPLTDLLVRKALGRHDEEVDPLLVRAEQQFLHALLGEFLRDRKSTRLNSSHVKISYAVFCLKKKNWP